MGVQKLSGGRELTFGPVSIDTAADGGWTVVDGAMQEVVTQIRDVWWSDRLWMVVTGDRAQVHITLSWMHTEKLLVQLTEVPADATLLLHGAVAPAPLDTPTLPVLGTSDEQELEHNGAVLTFDAPTDRIGQFAARLVLTAGLAGEQERVVVGVFDLQVARLPAEPTAPWTPQQSKRGLTTDALGVTLLLARGAKVGDDVLAQVTRNFAGLGRYAHYDVNSRTDGAIVVKGGECTMSSYVTLLFRLLAQRAVRSRPIRVDCYDVSSLLYVMARLLGDQGPSLVQVSDLELTHVLALGGSWAELRKFGNHQLLYDVKANKTYDGCVTLDGDARPFSSPYTPYGASGITKEDFVRRIDARAAGDNPQLGPEDFPFRVLKRDRIVWGRVLQRTPQESAEAFIRRLADAQSGLEGVAEATAAAEGSPTMAVIDTEHPLILFQHEDRVYSLTRGSQPESTAGLEAVGPPPSTWEFRRLRGGSAANAVPAEDREVFDRIQAERPSSSHKDPSAPEDDS